MRLSFTIAAGPRQRSQSQVRVSRNSWPYFSVSDSRLPQTSGPDPRFYIPQEQGGPVIPLGTGFLFRRLHTGSHTHTHKSKLCYDRRSASQSVLEKAPFCRLRPDLYYCLTVAGLLMWGALSDERTGLSFTIAAGPRQRCHFRVRVP
jgi:hypothetical protein